MADRFRPGLENYFRIGAILFLLPSFILFSFGYILFQEVNTTFVKVSEELFSEIAPAYRLRELLEESSMAVHDYLINHRPSDHERFLSAKTQLNIAFAHFSRSYEQDDNPLNVRVLKGAEYAWKEISETAEELITVRDSEPSSSRLSRLNERLDDQMTMARQSLETFIFFEKEEVLEKKKTIAELNFRFQTVFWAVTACALLLFLMAAVLFRRKIIAPLTSLNEAISVMEGGKFVVAISDEYPGEIGQLARSFNSMATDLNDTLRSLEVIASRDDLTGLYNAREFHLRLGLEIGRSDRYGHPLSLILLDLDYFKAVNDTHGHLIGDATLKTCANLVISCVRPADQACRYGGEEFAIICPETSADEAFNLAERIRKSFLDKALDVRGIPIRLTVSLGIAGYPEHDRSVAGLMEKADKALYEAKHAGRNKTRIAPSLTTSES